MNIRGINAECIMRARCAMAALAALVLLSGASASAQPTDWSRVHDVTLRGVNLIYDLEMDRAVTAFDSVIAMAPGDPRGYFFKSMVYFWTYSLRNEQQDLDRFMDLSDTVIDICEGLVDKNENDAVARFYLGGIHGYRGLAEQVQGSMVKAVMEGRKGYKELEEAVRLQPDLYDAQMGFGLFRYLVAKIPGSFAWVVRLIGFDGDLEGGLKSLELAATKGVYTRSEASFFLSQFLYNEHRRDEAFAMMQSLIRRHPDNTLFLVLYSSWQMRNGNYAEAENAINKASAVNARKKIKYGEEFIHSTRASIAYTNNDFATARQEYDLFLKQHESRNMIPNYTYYRMASSRDIMGDRTGAIEVCKLMKEGEMTGGYNQAYLYRKGQELIAQSLSAAEILNIKAGNAMSRKEFDSASVYYGAALNAAGDDADSRAAALYGLQQVFMNKGLDTTAVRYGKEAVALKPVHETWIPPHAYVLLAQSYKKLNRPAEALRALDQADKYDDYDFRKSLKSRIEEERTKVNQPAP